ncbi:MAG: ATP-binding protein [Cytophagales bacterium]|nr:ATP-binding protein [Cytophagales bacterium]
MIYSARAVSLILAGMFAFLTGVFVYLLVNPPLLYSTLVVLGSFGLAYGIIFYTLEWLVFHDIRQLYDVLERLKARDSKPNKKKKKLSRLPISSINQEIFRYANKKEQEIDELKKLENYRREFLADISHELKTPIFAAQGYIHTLLDGAMDDKSVRDKFLKKAAKNLDGLNNMVQNLIALSQMETGEVKMDFEYFDLVPMIKEVFDQLDGKAEKKECILKLVTEPNMTYYVSADYFKLKQVFTNLIENGIKYGNEKGNVNVILTRDKEEVLVSVKDDGPGIPPEHLNRIFDRFYRVEKSRSKDKGGSGLGLSIVKHIIQKHNSKVSVTSKVDKGTTFSFTLDAKAPEDAATIP